MVDRGEPEHVAGLDEGLVLGDNLSPDDPVFDVVGEPAGIEAVLQRAVLGAVESAHRYSFLGATRDRYELTFS